MHSPIDTPNETRIQCLTRHLYFSKFKVTKEQDITPPKTGRRYQCPQIKMRPRNTVTQQKHSASHPKFASHALPTQLWGVQAEPGAANYKKRQNQNPYRTVPGHKRTWARRPSNKTWVTKYRKETYDHHCRADIHRGWAIPRLPGMSINHDHETQPPPKRKYPRTPKPRCHLPKTSCSVSAIRLKNVSLWYDDVVWQGTWRMSLSLGVV